MQLIETSMLQERGQLPLPAASLVIDMRGINHDNVIDWLQIEIADLASEMKTHNIYHWRYLTEFLSFMRIDPQPESNVSSSPDEDTTANDIEPHGPLGAVYPNRSRDYFALENGSASFDESEVPFDHFEQEISELIIEIDRIRNNRIAAVKDLNKAAIPGRSNRDATVRVIFLTDINYPESLSSAALYAERLKAYYRKLERPGHQTLVNTTVLCLSNSGEAGPPKLLIERLRRNNSWEHVDALILSENYREDAARIGGNLQAYIAELLLYVLLIIPPLTGGKAGEQSLPATNGSNGKTGEQQVTLPLHTYIIGLAALEYSARWGHRWLNFGLAREVIDVLRQKQAYNPKERVRLADLANSWLQDWRHRIHEAIPERVSGEVPALNGIYRAREVSDSAHPVFTNSHFNLHIGESTIRDLRDYLAKLAHTYVTTSSDPALQDALMQSTTQIMQALRQREPQRIEQRASEDLRTLQTEAKQILGHPKFFMGAAGAVPRARAQLNELENAFSHFYQEHQQNSLNPVSMKDNLHYRRQELNEAGEKRIEGLQKHLQRWPIISGTGLSKLLLGVLTVLLILFMTAMAIFAGSAWVHHFIVQHLYSFLPSLDNVVLGIPVIEFVAGIIATLILILEFILLWPVFVDKTRSGFSIELAFLITLVVFMLFGFFVNYSLGSLNNLVDDPVSIHYLLWLSFLPGLGLICALFALIIIITEFCYTIWWLSYLHQERQRIVQALQGQHQQDIQDVLNFIADDVALDMAQRAELTDGNGGPGSYHARVAQLCTLLDELADKARDQQELASRRLLFNIDETQQESENTARSKSWLNLHIREEKLEMEALTEGYKALKQELERENPQMRVLAEFLLRGMGVEKPFEIGEQIEESQQGLSLSRLQILTTALVASATRFTVEPLSYGNIDELLEHYKRSYDLAWQEIPALNALIATLSKLSSRAVLESFTRQNGNNQPKGDVSAHAIATWGQLFWQQRNGKLNEVLQLDSVLAHLQRILQEDYDPIAVMRRLLMYAEFFGRSLPVGQQASIYLLLAPSVQSERFRAKLKGLKLPPTIDFPDIERILLLGVKHYAAEPVTLTPLPEKKLAQLPEPSADSNSSNGAHANGTTGTAPMQSLSQESNEADPLPSNGTQQTKPDPTTNPSTSPEPPDPNLAADNEE